MDDSLSETLLADCVGRRGEIGALLKANGAALNRSLQEETMKHSRLGIPLIFAFPSAFKKEMAVPDVNIFNFWLQLEVLKCRLKVLVVKNYVLEFQHEYLDFKFLYGKFSLKYGGKKAPNCQRNTEKAGLPCGSPA